MDRIFSMPGNEAMAEKLRQTTAIDAGLFEIRHFPDGETYVRVSIDVKGLSVAVLCTLANPDEKLLPVIFLAEALRGAGALEITLVAPYLSYMRQDKRFLPGEALTSVTFAGLISSSFNRLITVDPHLHRHKSMDELYTIPCSVLHASGVMAQYISENISRPLVVGPDSESRQWVSEVATKAGAPYIVLEKERVSDNEVIIHLNAAKGFEGHTPVLVDDIISTAHTMTETVKQLRTAGLGAPVCMGVHPVFAGNSFRMLLEAGVKSVVTCDTIPHHSGVISVAGLLGDELNRH